MVEVEAGKKATSVEVLVTTAFEGVSGARATRRALGGPTRLVALSISDDGQAGHEADGDETRAHLALGCCGEEVSCWWRYERETAAGWAAVGRKRNCCRG